MTNHQKEMQILMHGLGFSQHDLKLNRQGKLTELQLGSLRQEIYSDALPHFIIGVITVVAGFWMTNSAIRVSLDSPIPGGSADYLFLLLLIPGGYYTLAGAIQLIRGVSQTVWSASGSVQHVQKQTRGRYPRTVLQIRMGGLTLPLPDTAARTFAEGDTYTIYFVEHPPTILSAEPVNDGK